MNIIKNKDHHNENLTQSLIKQNPQISLLDVPIKYFQQGLTLKNNYPSHDPNVNELLSNKSAQNKVVIFPEISLNNNGKYSFEEKSKIEYEKQKGKVLMPIYKSEVKKLSNLSPNNPNISNQISRNNQNKDQKETFYNSLENMKFSNLSSDGESIFPVLSTVKGKEWMPRVNKQNLFNHSSVGYSITSPTTKGISKTKQEILKEAKNEYNPCYYQRSISEFYELSQVYGSHNNPFFKEALKNNKNTFMHKSNICNNYYKNYKSYEGIALKPFTKTKFK